MEIKVAVGRGLEDYDRRPLFADNANPPAVNWILHQRRRRDDTKYATLVVSGWKVEFHEYQNKVICNRWLMISRKADRRGPVYREARLRIPDFDVGGTLTLKIKNGAASASLCMGDLTAELWDKYGIGKVKRWNQHDWSLYRVYRDEDGMTRYIDTVFAGGAPNFIPMDSGLRPDIIELNNAQWAVVLSANNRNGKNMLLTAYTSLNHTGLEEKLDEFVARYDVQSFFQGQKRMFAVYSDDNY